MNFLKKIWRQTVLLLLFCFFDQAVDAVLFLVFGSQFATVGNDSDFGLGSWILQEFNMHCLVVYIGLSRFKLNCGGKFFVWVPFGKMFSIWLKFFHWDWEVLVWGARYYAILDGFVWQLYLLRLTCGKLLDKMLFNFWLFMCCCRRHEPIIIIGLLVFYKLNLT